MRPSMLLPGLLASAFLTAVALPASADDEGEEEQRYPIAYADRPLTVPALTLAPDVGFDATNLVKDPKAVTKEFEPNFAFQAGFTLGILDALEVRASLGTLTIAPKVEWYEPAATITFRFVGADAFNMGIRAKATALTRDPELEGAILEGSLPFLIRFGQSVRLDLAPGVLLTAQETKEMAFGLNVPVSFAFQMVEAVGLGAQTSAYISSFDNPGENLTIPLGFFAAIGLGSTRPMVDVVPYFTWTEFSRPGAKLDNEKVNIDKWSAGGNVRLYLYL